MAAPYLFRHKSRACGQLDEQIDVIRLHLGRICGFVAHRSAAFFAAVDDDIPLLRIRQDLYRLQKTKAIVCPVAGIDVDMDGAETLRAMIARGHAQRLDFEAAVPAGEAAVVFLKPFIFHFLFILPFYDCIKSDAASHTNIEQNRKECLI